MAHSVALDRALARIRRIGDKLIILKANRCKYLCWVNFSFAIVYALNGTPLIGTLHQNGKGEPISRVAATQQKKIRQNSLRSDRLAHRPKKECNDSGKKSAKIKIQLSPDDRTFSKQENEGTPTTNASPKNTTNIFHYANVWNCVELCSFSDAFRPNLFPSGRNLE